MRAEDGVLAWIRPTENGAVLALFVSKEVAGRAPASRRCRSADEARDWVEAEATALGASIEWVTEPAGSFR